MADDILTIEEVAKYLRVSERTVYDWAQKGEIPSGKIGTVWRFKKDDIEKWVNERLSGSTKTAPETILIHVQNILSPDRIVMLNHSTRHDALVSLSETLGTAPQIKNRHELTAEILKREELMSTAIGRGIAIPHVRLSSVTDLVMAVGICRNDIIDFQTIDDVPVRLIFMIAAAYNQHSYYLQTLSYFSKKLKNSDLRDSLLNAQTPLDAYNLLIE
ncbi:PTS sugar transporter subunit IIA [Brucepastera parasyntrophica]|uniref:PTS sugar transporter subunit IIA n=1 Tax=Brucepastera parasyntrophica TaxID=2880008 RepID=UPI00210D1759|nr:PTS sugar transporter subunit IIA [Brucepastera parasyntrophica]ULQ59673.1 PTS sugar transporter subunit IIA [Brucepastera parasyntrophica]